MLRKAAFGARWVLVVSILSLVTVSAAAGSTAASNGQPFPPGSAVEGSHADAVLILHNLGTGAGLRAITDGSGAAVKAESRMADGVIGTTTARDKSGVFGWSTAGVGVTARSDQNDGVVGWTGSKDRSGVWGNSTVGVGVRGNSTSNDGVRGVSVQGPGVAGRSDQNDGVVGSTASEERAGVYGQSTEGVGVTGRSDQNDGVVGWTGSKDKSAVWGHSTAGSGVTGTSDKNDGVVGWTGNKDKSGVWGHSTVGTGVVASSEQGTALFVTGTSIFQKYASFEGGHGDLAENYFASGELEGGDVVVIDSGRGLTLMLAGQANDTAVAGVISTAPAMKLKGLIDDAQGVPLVIAGRTLCKVDAAFGSIRPGDLLTSSPTPGYAMVAQPVTIGGIELYRPGTIIGKALEAWEVGKGLIMVLVTLQ
jgi:hypothetical protein